MFKYIQACPVIGKILNKIFSILIKVLKLYFLSEIHWLCTSLYPQILLLNWCCSQYWESRYCELGESAQVQCCRSHSQTGLVIIAMRKHLFFHDNCAAWEVTKWSLHESNWMIGVTSSTIAVHTVGYTIRGNIL